MRKKIIILLLIVFVIGIITILVLKPKHEMKKEKVGEPPQRIKVEVDATNNIKKDVTGKEFNEYEDDRIAEALKDNVKVSNIKIMKTGNSSSLRESDIYGKNAGIIANNKINAQISNSKIKTEGKGSSGIVATEDGTILKVENTQIETKEERSRGIVATDSAKIEANNVNVITRGYKASGVAIDFMYGEIELSDSEITTNGIDSVPIYSVGKITAKNSTLISNNAECVVIDGNNKVELENVIAVAGKKRGIALYYTGPKTKGDIIGKITVTGGSLDVKDGPVIYVTNTTAEINLSNVNIKSNSNIFLQAKIDTDDELSQEGTIEKALGGKVILKAENQIIKGDILLDNESTLNMNLSSNSIYNGKVNGDKTGKEIKITIDETSKWQLTGDSYITVLDNEDISNSNIDLNGYKLYVNGKIIN